MHVAGPSSRPAGRPAKIPSRKLVVLGDGACGKTSMLTVFTQGFFPTDYEPTVFENFVETLTIDGQPMELSLWDTAGQEDFDRLRSLSYADTHVVLICFSVERPESLENVEAKWIGEALHYCPGVRVILVALKCDLRSDPTVIQHLRSRGARGPIEYEEGLAVAQRIRATRYLECSAKMNRGVREAIEEAARVALAKAKPAKTMVSQGARSGSASERLSRLGDITSRGKGKGCIIS